MKPLCREALGRFNCGICNKTAYSSSLYLGGLVDLFI
jgi:hypothetical protein